MTETELETLRYPVGKFVLNVNADDKEINQWISNIENHPSQIRNAVKGLNDQQLNTTYRDGGWTLTQVVHHLADSHMNAYIRIKLALTETNPTIKPYDENAWSAMDDAKNLPVEISLTLLDSLHIRWTHMLTKLLLSDLDRTVYHPESKREMSVKFLISLYSWHSIHHTAHITSLRKRKGW